MFGVVAIGMQGGFLSEYEANRSEILHEEWSVRGDSGGGGGVP